MGLAYLVKNDSVHAAQAFIQSVSKGEWKYRKAYENYIKYCINGKLAPTIPKNEIAAADLYEKSWLIDDRLEAGKLYFKNEKYKEAYDIFITEQENYLAKGYLGIIYRYGLGGIDIDLRKAYKYLSRVPDENVFMEHKGDLALYLLEHESKDYYYKYECIVESAKYAYKCYKAALKSDTNNECLVKKCNLIKSIIDTEKKYSKRGYISGKVNWGSNYNYNNDQYYKGEQIYINKIRFHSHNMQGWGCCYYYNGEIKLGKYNRNKANGAIFHFIPKENGFATFVGEYKNDTPVSGYYTTADGTTYVGEFYPDYKLKKGIIYNIIGKKLKEVK